MNKNYPILTEDVVAIDLEKWKPIKAFEGYYEISSLGRVKSCDRIVIHINGKEQPVDTRVMSLKTTRDGYKALMLAKEGIRKDFRVHRLVAEAFIPNTSNKPQVNHKDGNKQNNIVENLEWCTASENNFHAFKLGLRNNKGTKNASSKLTDLAIREIRLSTLKTTELMLKYNVTRPTICDIKALRSWKHVK